MKNGRLIKYRGKSPERSAALSPTNSQKGSEPKIAWVHGEENSAISSPSESSTQLYTELHAKAAEQRQAEPSGTCPKDLEILYQFWSQFLLKHFNTKMYKDFRQLALDDARNRQSDVGLKSLIKFYSESLDSPLVIRYSLARDYVDLVRSEETERERPALKQLRSAWRNGALNLKNRKKISDLIDVELRRALEG